MKDLIHPLWWGFIALFWVHQFFEKIMTWHWRFADNHLDSLLCMPVLLGGILLERRLFWGRKKDYVLPLLDTIVAVLVLSFICEEGFPRWHSGFTHDYWDYLCYGIGGLFFYVVLNVKVVEP